MASLFFSKELTSKKGELGRVWLASTIGDRKLSKAQLLSTSIIKSIQAIANVDRQATVVEEDESEDEHEVAAVPMALRLSGQLLLGVARIYSRKAKYLVDDCNEALLKIRMTFRVGASTSVDMAADQTRAPKNSITRQDDTNEFDLLYADLYDSWATFPVPAPVQKTSKKVAQAKDSDITLPDTEFDMIGNRYNYHDNELSGVIDSQLYLGDETFDLGMDENAFEHGADATPTRKKRPRKDREDDDDDDDISVELGRDAPHSSARKSARLASDQVNPDGDLEFSHDLGGGADITFDDLEFGGQQIEFDFDFGGQGNDAPADGMRTPRAGSPNGADAPPDESVEVTPRTAAQVNANAKQVTKKKTTRAKTQPKQIIDEVTELAAQQPMANGSPARRRTDAEEPSSSQSLARSGADGRAERIKMGIILESPQFLPKSRLQMRFLEIEQDPAAYYFPRVGENKDQLYLGPPGIAPELQELFVIPLDARRKRLQSDAAESASKRARDEGDLSVEIGRRASSQAPSLNVDASAMGGGNDFDAFDDLNAGPIDDSFQFDLNGAAPREQTPSIKGGLAVPRGQSSRLSTPAPAKASQGPLRVFDVEAPPSISRSGSLRSITPAASQQTPTKSSVINGEHGSGWSKNTLKAVQVISEALDEEQGVEAKCSFEQVSGKASRQAAAAFFFECLVLGTRDRVKLAQVEPYADIDISPKERFWELNATAAQSSPIAAR